MRHLPLSSLARVGKQPQTLYAARQCMRRFGYTSSSSPPSAGKRPLPFPLGFLGIGGGLVAAYFLWPDTSRSAPTYTDAALSPTHFTPVTVTASEPCADPSTRLITLTVPPRLLPSLQNSIFSPVWSIFIKDDDIQVERPYTPLEGIDEAGRMKFWIKRYPKGEVGRWLHSKGVGNRIEIRGPLKTWNWLDDTWDEVVMISGGTGITPFYQLLHRVLLSRPETACSTRFTLLHSSRVPGELPPPELLRPLKEYAQEYPDRLRLSFFVDVADGTSAQAVSMHEIRQGRIGKAEIAKVIGDGNGETWWWQRLLRVALVKPTPLDDRKVLFLVCGPEPMVQAIAGPYGRNYSQGAIGGILGGLGCAASQVWKF
ncbi:ferredoxin reductase-like protein [Cytidiella melzeri]|nr:ferredoxin reductase-like protein [Cytidiella melzeri]